MKDSEKGCHNCAHRFGAMRSFWQCSRTGFFTETEMQFGGRCAEGKRGTELRLWSLRPTPLQRVINILRIERATRTESANDSGGWIGGA